MLRPAVPSGGLPPPMPRAASTRNCCTSGSMGRLLSWDQAARASLRNSVLDMHSCICTGRSTPVTSGCPVLRNPKIYRKTPVVWPGHKHQGCRHEAEVDMPCNVLTVPVRCRFNRRVRGSSRILEAWMALYRWDRAWAKLEQWAQLRSAEQANSGVEQATVSIGR